MKPHRIVIETRLNYYKVIVGEKGCRDKEEIAFSSIPKLLKALREYLEDPAETEEKWRTERALYSIKSPGQWVIDNNELRWISSYGVPGEHVDLETGPIVYGDLKEPEENEGSDQKPQPADPETPMKTDIITNGGFTPFEEPIHVGDTVYSNHPDNHINAGKGTAMRASQAADSKIITKTDSKHSVICVDNDPIFPSLKADIKDALGTLMDKEEDK